MKPRVNKWLDLIDRAGWTALQAAAGAGLAALTLNLGWHEFLVVVLTAAGVAVCKVVIGQNTGDDNTGSLIGTDVIEPDVKD